ncbi:hypothetical protein GGP41_008687 [Bipolaris sorokiniana]|uniref:Uncharacterized protein n=1 Tax=Cochliobolus sativus TaxID=45130 RepID=A0A8H6DQJ6_COCSA|nr:hypothetical protein GGP41_008687 [Bipolaris sorokiniana]
MSEDSRSTVDINALPPKPRAPANVMPGGTAHTAGGEKTSDAGPTYIDALQTGPWQLGVVFLSFPTKYANTTVLKKKPE